MTTPLHDSVEPSERAGVEATGQATRIAALAILVITSLITVYVRLRLLSVPLERDEGEYAYLGQLMLQGWQPFRDAYSMKLPGTAMMYALFMGIFGQTPQGIHIGLLVVNALTAWCVWLIARRLFEVQTAAASTAIFLLLTLSKSVLGVFAHATHFVNLFALAGVLLLLKYREKDQPHIVFVSGICFGAAILMKQHAVTMAIFAFCLTAWLSRKRTQRWAQAASSSALFASGTAIPLALIALWMITAGTFGKFWFWTFEYARDYATSVPLSEGLSILQSQFTHLVSLEFPLWILAASGIAVLFIVGRRNDPFALVLLVGLLVASFAAVCPGFYFRDHYFVLMLPYVALLSGLAVTKGISLVSANRAGSWLGAVPPVLLLAALGSGFFVVFL